MQTNSKTCPKCGKPVPSGFAGQSCPQCLMALGLNGGSPTTARSGGIDAHVPPVEQLVSAFPNLEIQHLIGHGGMGAVFQAVQVNLDRTVALKILSPVLSRDPAFAERFLREAQTLAKLSHPNIVTVFDFGEAGDFYYLTMEFVDGVNLRDTISANLLCPSEALAIVPQICDALQYAHDSGVVHRDIKPENILIAKSGGVKIADFGLAKILDPSPNQFTLTGTQQVLGTRNYMAPEQIESPDAVDHRADLYSLGVVFYELLTGELPLGRFSLPSEKTASVTSKLDDVVMRTLEKDPAKRYQQASQIKTACASVGQGEVDGRDGPASSRNEENANLSELDSPAICPPFPCTIENIYGSLASGQGIMRGFETHLDLEFEIRDTVVDHKWSSTKFQLPINKISWIKMHRGWMSNYVEIQADDFESVSELPNSKAGMFRVHLKQAATPEAEQLVHNVQRMLRVNSPSLPSPPVKAIDAHSQTAGKKSSGNSIVAILLVMFLGLCSVVVVGLVLGAMWFFSGVGQTPNAEVGETIAVLAEPFNDPGRTRDTSSDWTKESDVEIGSDRTKEGDFEIEDSGSASLSDASLPGPPTRKFAPVESTRDSIGDTVPETRDVPKLASGVLLLLGLVAIVILGLVVGAIGLAFFYARPKDSGDGTKTHA